MTQSTGEYRQGIDGLRAIAVLGVVLAHAGVSGFEGGFVGVDVFFVISGFLITRILLRELENGSFSLARFYERRVRRIFPALYAMLVLVSIPCWFILLPVDFKEFGESVAAVAFFLSNFYFDLKSGYFESSAELRPLLHTWSLGVEEQFYLVFPLLLVVLSRLVSPLMRLVALCLLWLGSLAAAAFMLGVDGQGVFYLPWYRAWELLCGSLLAAIGSLPALNGWWGTRIRAALAPFGLLLVIGPMLCYDTQIPFPAQWALPPVIGSALILAGTTSGLAERLLGLAPLVHVGRISYSLYLWHWPPLALLRYTSGHEPGAVPVLLAITSAFLLAELSYRFVEQPMRRITGVSTWRLLSGGVAVSLVAFGLGATARLYGGMPWRLPSDVARISAVALDINPRRNECDSRSSEQIAANDICVIGREGAAVTFAVVGDSFADAFMPGVARAAEEAGTSGLVLTRGGCNPMIGTDQGGGTCDLFFRAAVKRIATDPQIGSVLLISRWTSAFEASRFGFDQRSGMFVSDAKHPVRTLETTRIVTEAGLDKLLWALEGKHIHLAAFVPEQPIDVPRTYGLAALFGREVGIALQRPDFEARQSFTRSTLARLAKRHAFVLIDLGALMCGPGGCPAVRDGIPLYVDDNHVSRTAAISLRHAFWGAVGDLPSP